MIKVLWNQCECETEVQNMGLNQALAGSYEHHVRIERCRQVGHERKFTDGATALMCDGHWDKCTAIVDKDGAKHVKPDNQAVG